MQNKVLDKIDHSNELIWQSRFSGSAKIKNKASRILIKSEKLKYQKGQAYADINLGAIFFYESNNEISLKYLTEAFQWFRDNKYEKGYVRALLLKGNIYESFGDYETTLRLWIEAYNTSTKLDDTEAKGEACSQLGLIYSRLNNYQKALAFLNKGLKIRKELKDEKAIASSYNRIGMVFRLIKKYERSLKFYFRSLEIRIRNNQTAAIPWTLLGIASTYEDMGKLKESVDYYEQGIASIDKRCSLQCLMGAGRVYSKSGDPANAQQKLEKSLFLARELKSPSLIADAYLALANHYESFNEFEKAYINFKEYLTARESFQSIEIQNRINSIETAHAVESSQHEKEIFRLRYVELKEAYTIIENKNKYITASINYASRIQNAILPSQDLIRALNINCFILYIPKEIVSGDFYWFSKVNGKLIIAAADCTGHGVPGALMSMLGISFLEEIINKRQFSDTGLILNELRKEIIDALHQKGELDEAKDGMDISICSIDKTEHIVQYSGANNNLILVRKNELVVYNADKMPIGTHEEGEKPFNAYKIAFKPGDMIYMYSDGYADQFGGPNRKKLNYSAFKSIILEIHNHPLKDQKKRLEKEFLKWKGKEDQTDDVMVMGIRL